MQFRVMGRLGRRMMHYVGLDPPSIVKENFWLEGANGRRSVMYRENLALTVQKAPELIELPLR